MRDAFAAVGEHESAAIAAVAVGQVVAAAAGVAVVVAVVHARTWSVSELVNALVLVKMLDFVPKAVRAHDH